MIKKLFGFLIVSLVPMLFIVALYIGYQDPEPEVEEVTAAPPSTPVRSYAPPVVEETADVPEEVDLSVPTEVDKTEASEVAKAFIQSFHRLSPDDPLLYLKDAETYMTPRMLTEYEGIPKRGTLGVTEIQAEHVEVMPVELNADMQVWTGEVTSLENPGTAQEESVYEEYQVLLYKQNGEWRVDGVKMNER